MPLSPNARLGRYEIRSKIGAGGMGEVYLALDTRLGRTVALKILPAEVVSDQKRMHRFEQEARAASALNHPNIITIHEIGEADSTHFISTEFVDGETLREHMSRGRLGVPEALDVGIQVAAALSAAHAAGVVHRDIKPENVMVRRDRLVKVLDFGLAKLTEAQPAAVDTEAPTIAKVQTDPGTVMGTVHYMSPEQARGLEVDARTDIWSLGVVLYEMLAGRRPFTGATTTDVLAAIVKTAPAPLAQFDEGVPARLDEIISKALEKDRDERYQGIKDLLVDLRRLKKRMEFEAEVERSAPPDSASAQTAAADSAEHAAETKAGRAATAGGAEAARTAAGGSAITGRVGQHKLVFAAASLILLAALGLGIYRLLSRPSSSEAPIESIAVLPFVNAGGDAEMEYLSDGITESLINNLARLPNLRVIARSTVFAFKGREVSPQQLARQLNVRAILTGRVTDRGDTLSIQVDLVDAESGAEIWGEQYHRGRADILAVQEDIAREITDRLRLGLTGEERKLLTKRYTNNPAAYEDYLKGRYHYYKGNEVEWRQALDAFRQAVALDPDYALAHAGIADCYGIASGWLMPPTEAYPKLEEEALTALRIDDSLAAARAALAGAKLFYEHDWPGAEQELKRALALDPDSTPARLYYSFYLYALGRTDECISVLKEGLKSDPLSLPLNTNLGEAFYYARRYDEALEVTRKTLEIDRNSVFTLLLAGWAYQQKGMFKEAVAQFQQAAQIEDGPWAAAALGNVYAASGQKDEAMKELAKLEEMARRRYVSPYFFALVHTGLSDSERAFASLNKAYDEHNDYLIYLRVEPLFDSLRADPRFQDLLRRMRFPQ